jgi:hypothetical protein
MARTVPLLHPLVVPLGLLFGLLGPALAAPGAQKTVCAITINSDDEKRAFERYLPAADYRVVELTRRGEPDWLAQACRSGVRCDALVISGHFDDGSEFYADQSDHREYLTLEQLQQASCSASCSGLFAQLQEVFLFGCKTLGNEPRIRLDAPAVAERERSLQLSGHSAAEAERLARELGDRYAQSNRDRLRHVFQGVPLLYGFSAQAPLGRVAGPLVERYFHTAAPGEVASGRPSATWLSLFGPMSMVTARGLSPQAPEAALRRDLCGFADDAPSSAVKVRHLHTLLKRDPAEVRLLLDLLERFVASLTPALRIVPEVDAALSAFAQDRPLRQRLQDFWREVEDTSAQLRFIGLARQLGWLDDAQVQDEWAHLLERRLAQGPIGRSEIDLTCAQHPQGNAALLQRLAQLPPQRSGSQPQPLPHAALRACLGDSAAHQQLLQALVRPPDAHTPLVETYLRHRGLGSVGAQRVLAAGVGRLPDGQARLQALESLARQRLDDPPALQEIARQFAHSRSLPVQRAIAHLLLRADTRELPRADLAAALQRHRIKSPDGRDVIDLLIRRLLER